jgi:HlyD family secretion protein
MKKKVVVSTLVVVGLAVLSYGLFLRSPSPKFDFRFDKVTIGDLTALVTATGTINPVISVDVGTQVSGVVAKLYADFNSVVKQGQLIAQIDPTFLEQSVKDAEASLEKAQAQEADSKRNYTREKELLDKGLDSQLNFDAALTAYETNKAATKSAQASLDRAKINLAYATIYAPISGVVINRAVNVGQTVAASFSSPTLYTIANDLSKMQVLTTVDESDIGKISIGQEATFTVDSYPDETFTGIISQIRLAPLTVQNVVNYTVVIDVNNDKLKLMPGMTANVKVQVADAHDVLRIPNMALRFQPPAELVDSSKITALKDAFASRGRGGDSSRSTSVSTPNSGITESGKGNRFREMKDSITAAHGGNMSQDELRSEMQKVMTTWKGGAKPPAKPVIPQMKIPSKTAQFGIEVRFPEYQKSAYVPLHQAGRARVWVLNAAGKLEPVIVRTGITDGKFTEVSSQTLKAGDQIVMGVTSNGDVASAKSPLTGGGGGQQRPGGGGGFR